MANRRCIAVYYFDFMCANHQLLIQRDPSVLKHKKPYKRFVYKAFLKAIF
jgi:hypothetical protein